MKIIKAGSEDWATVQTISHATIRAVYPHYYPQGVVDFFLAHHSEEHIRRDIDIGCVYLLADGVAVGTVTINDNEINRLFVLTEYQGKGYGGRLLDFAEAAVFKDYDEAVVAASFPGKPIYLKRGYREYEYGIIEAPRGDFLCYDMMKKQR